MPSDILAPNAPKIKTGLDILIAERMDELAGLRLGITANCASVTGDGTHITDAVPSAGGWVTALFGPEHGIRGDAPAGAEIGNATDERLGVPIYSLYGATKAPTPEMLDAIDVMIVDLQDIGARFWTFESTVANVMESCGQCGVPVYILDRPNPISGLDPEGPILRPPFSSFVGMFPIPVRHALTIGELARLFHARFDVRCDLRLIEMRGWKREMWFEDTGLPWVRPSPGMRDIDTAAVYPGTCLLEGTNVSEGRGTPCPFETFGAPWVDPDALRQAVRDYDLPGLASVKAYFYPKSSKHQGLLCKGLQIRVADRQSFRPVLTGVAILCALRKLYPTELAFREHSPDGRCFFDLLAGADSLRDQIESGADPHEIAASWADGVAAFGQATREILAYQQ